MRIYFYTNQEIDNQAAKEVILCLKRAGLEVITDTSKDKQATVNGVLPKAEATIFQGKYLDDKGSYLLAFSLAQNKKVLCLLPEGSKIDSNLANLQSLDNMSGKINIEIYNTKNLKEKVYDFLKKLDTSTAKDLYNIKYTLRVSKNISQYLDFKSKESGTPKADWLRNKIVEMMSKDDKYQDFSANKFELSKD